MALNDPSTDRRVTAIFAIVCVFCQLMFTPAFAIFQGHINFMLILAFCAALEFGNQKATLWGFCAGLFFDFTTSGPIGLMTVELTCLCFLLTYGENAALGDGVFESWRTFLVCAAVVELVYQFAMIVSGNGGTIVDALFLRWLPATLLDCIAVLPFLYAISRSAPQGLSMSKGRKDRRGGGPRYTIRRQ